MLLCFYAVAYIILGLSVSAKIRLLSVVTLSG
jgi:hypothetical protein